MPLVTNAVTRGFDIYRMDLKPWVVAQRML